MELSDSDYGAYQLCREFSATPSALSLSDSTSLVSESNYSAFTPLVERKAVPSVVSTPLPTPKLNRDFGFVSSTRESRPKPPRRRSREAGGAGCRAGGRLARSPSRETTPVNQPAAVSPVRPGRAGRAGPRHPAAPRYEPLGRPSRLSSSDSDSDFVTPQASPVTGRRRDSGKTRITSNNKNSRHSTSSIYEDIASPQQSYENFNDNPIADKKTKRFSQSSADYAKAEKITKAKIIPPRASQEPIPTPRRSALSRSVSRDQSSESLPTIASLPRKLTREPHYKVPPSNPRPVRPQYSHTYSELVYKQDLALENNKTKSLEERRQVDRVNNNQSRVSTSGKERSKARNSLEIRETLPCLPGQVNAGGRDRSQSQNGQNPENKQELVSLPNGKHPRGGDRSLRDSRVELELNGGEDRFYHTLEDLVKKSKGIATLPDGSKYPCLIVQKKSKKQKNITEPDQPDTSSEQPARIVKNYIPTEMPLKPDWFDDLKINKSPVRTNRPKSIVDGVLYTSKALLDSEKEMTKLHTFNLIESEVFETYDVCQTRLNTQSAQVNTRNSSASERLICVVTRDRTSLVMCRTRTSLAPCWGSPAPPAPSPRPAPAQRRSATSLVAPQSHSSRCWWEAGRGAGRGAGNCSLGWRQQSRAATTSKPPIVWLPVNLVHSLN